MSSSEWAGRGDTKIAGLREKPVILRWENGGGIINHQREQWHERDTGLHRPHIQYTPPDRWLLAAPRSIDRLRWGKFLRTCHSRCKPLDPGEDALGNLFGKGRAGPLGERETDHKRTHPQGLNCLYPFYLGHRLFQCPFYAHLQGHL